MEIITFYAKEGEKLLNFVLAMYPEIECLASLTQQATAKIEYYITVTILSHRVEHQ